MLLKYLIVFFLNSKFQRIFIFSNILWFSKIQISNGFFLQTKIQICNCFSKLENFYSFKNIKIPSPKTILNQLSIPFSTKLLHIKNNFMNSNVKKCLFNVFVFCCYLELRCLCFVRTNTEWQKMKREKKKSEEKKRQKIK